MGYNLVLYTIHNISVYKWHRFCKSAFIISYSLFIFKGKNVNLKHKSTIHQIKVTVRHVKPLKSQEGMMPTILLKCQLNYHCTLFVSLLKVIDDLYTSTLEKKVNIFPQTPPLSFGLSPDVKMAENILVCLCPQ